jgi:hypothetical protein
MRILAVKETGKPGPPFQTSQDIKRELDRLQQVDQQGRSVNNSEYKVYFDNSAAVNLEVVISDPNQKQKDEEFLDMMGARQSVLFEIYDRDRGKTALSAGQLGDEFLGECWLDSLGTLTSKKKLVLPIHNAGVSDNGTRKDAKGAKNLKPYDPEKNTGVKCTGYLHVEAHWQFPSPKKPNLDNKTDLEKRSAEEEARHTGNLYLKILKAEGLRKTGVFFKGSDPYVVGYIRNDAYNRDEDPDAGWRKTVYGYHEELFRTSVEKTKDSTVVWKNEEFPEIRIVTGAFEKKTKMAKHIVPMTGRAQQRIHDEHALKALGGKGEEIKIYFPGQGQVRDYNYFFDPAKRQTLPQADLVEGSRHSVVVYIGDSIQKFKDKLRQACSEEALKEHEAYQEDKKEVNKQSALGRNISEDALSDRLEKKLQYQSIADALNFNYVVMVFVQSKRLRQLTQANQSNQTNETKRLLNTEFNDPSSWEPLSIYRTFSHYAFQYGFSNNGKKVVLRVAEGTDSYRTKNSRYKEFEKGLRSWGLTVENTDNEEKCFGYVKYIHKDDHSEEWRPALIKNDNGERLAEYTYVHGGGKDIYSEHGTKVSDGDVIYRTKVPKILGSAHLAHQKYLVMIPDLFNKKGITDKKEIADKLNTLLQVDINQAKSMGGAVPPRIEVKEIEDYINILQQEGKLNFDESASPTPASPSLGAPTPYRPSPTPSPAAQTIVSPAAAPGPSAPAPGAPAVAKAKPKLGPGAGPGAAGRRRQDDGPSMGFAQR